MCRDALEFFAKLDNRQILPDCHHHRNPEHFVNLLTQNNRYFSPLFSDPEVAEAFGDDRICSHFLAYEIALTESLAASGAVDADLASKAIHAMRKFEPDLQAIEAACPVDGLAVPEFVRQLKRYLGPHLCAVAHIGGTSQDLIDTAMVLTLRECNLILAKRLDSTIVAIEDLIAVHGRNTLMGRTRMQDALPITVEHRLNSWRGPLLDHRRKLDQLLPQLNVLQFGGATGDRSANGQQAAKIGRIIAEKLDLTDPGYAWHNDRSRLVEYAGWLSLVSGSLGKIGLDICLMAQQGIDEIVQTGGGSSSAMAHKKNPITAELLVTLARYNAGQLPLMHSALVHEQERSGAAWSLEWMVLPAMVCTTGKALDLTRKQLQAISRIGNEP